MGTQNYGWFAFGATSGSAPPTNMTNTNVYVVLNVQNDGFYWTVTPAASVVAAIANGSTDQLTFILHKTGANPGQVSALDWLDNGNKDYDWITFSGNGEPPAGWTCGHDGGNRTITIGAGASNLSTPFSLNIKYHHGKRDTTVRLDPEIDVGMDPP